MNDIDKAGTIQIVENDPRKTQTYPLPSTESLIISLTRMATMVQSSVERAIEALLTRNYELAGSIALGEPPINAMECVIDEHAVRALLAHPLRERDVRVIVSTLKVNKDLERMGDLAVSIAQRVVTLANEQIATPPELTAMPGPVTEMVRDSLGALIFQNFSLAQNVLQTEPDVDAFRNLSYNRLLDSMKDHPSQMNAHFQLLLSSRYLERIADHCTNIAENVIYWIRGVDIRHGKYQGGNLSYNSLEDLE